MRHVTLIAKEDEEIGYVGLIINGMRNLDVVNPATEGRMVAHDLFEHVSGLDRIGSSAADELLALGALWYVRGRHADLIRPNYSIYSPEESVGSDVALCMRRWLNDGREFGLPVPKAENHIDSSLPYILRAVNPNDFGFEAEQGDLFKFLLGARHFLNHGYAMAVRRYRGDGMKANSMFWNVADALDEEVFKKDGLIEGQRFTLSYSRGDARVREQSESYY